jgi:hypothetical protein
MRVSILGDFLRANDDGTFHQASNIEWVAEAFTEALTSLGLNVTKHSKTLYGKPYTDLYRELYDPGHSLVEQWASLYDEVSLPKCLDFTFSNADDDLLIIFEGSPSILNRYNREGRKFIDIRVHNVRFSDELALAMYSNDKSILERLRSFAISENYFYEQAKTICSRFTSTSPMYYGALIFFGQCDNDASLIQDGRFLSIGLPGVLEQLGKLGAAIFHKPHPYQPTSKNVADWITSFPQSTLLEMNTYELLATVKNITVVTQSSCVGVEAKYFGHKAVFLSKNSNGIAPYFRSLYIPVCNHFFESYFWSRLLNVPIVEPLPTTMRTPQRLRRLIGGTWSWCPTT